MEYTCTHNHQSQFIEMFDFHELNLNSPSKDFESMCLDDTSSATKIPAAEYLQEGKYAVYDQAQEKDIAGYSNTEQGLCRNYPAVLFGDHSRVVKYINEPFFIGADGVKIIRPRKDNLIPEFLYYDLKYHNIPNTGYNRHFKYIKMISLTKASLEEQSQFLSIAHQADKSGFDGRKSQFIEMFGTIDEPKVEVKKLIDVVLSSGQYGSNTSATDYQESKPRYIRITDINDDGSLNDDIKTAEVIEDKYKLIPGDIVFARTEATVGKTYMHETGNAIYAGYLIKYQMDELKMKPAFMKAFTHSKTYYNWVANSQKVGAQPNISAAQYDNMPVLVPQIEKQEEFLTIYHQADKSGFELRKSIEAIDKVIKSLVNVNL